MSKYINVFEKYVSTCPSCGEQSFHIVEFSYKTPFFDEILIISGKCVKCGYRFFDVFNVKEHEPVRFILKVEKPVDLNSLVVRSQTGTILIPELGIAIEPGILASPYITTVEGVLYKVLDVLEVYKEEDKEAYTRTKRAIEEAIEGKVKFTFILEDPFGNSLLIPKRRESLEVIRLKGYKESEKNDN